MLSPLKYYDLLLTLPSDATNTFADGFCSVSLILSYSVEFQRCKERIENQQFNVGESVGGLNAPISFEELL